MNHKNESFLEFSEMNFAANFGGMLFLLFRKGSLIGKLDCKPFKRNWLTRTVFYTYDFEAHENLSQKQSVSHFGSDITLWNILAENV